MAPNYSLYSIPAYWALALWPHAYAVATLKKANNDKFNNVNARGSETQALYKKTVPAETYALFERAKAAHANMLENAPLFIGAVLAGNMVGLDASTLNTAVAAHLGLRIAYILCYIKITRNKYSYLRSVIWAAGLGILFTVFIKAGNKLAAQG